MKFKTVFSIGFLLFIAAAYTFLQHNSIQAETVINKGQEDIHKETVQVEDSTGEISEDTLLIVTDTLFVEEPELGIIDTIPYADTLNLTEEHEKQQDTIRIPMRRKIHAQRVSSFPNLFHHPLSMPLMAENDSVKIMLYLIREAFPQKKFDRYFGSYSLYKHTDEFDVRKNRVLIRSSFGGAPIHAPFALGLQGYMDVRFLEQVYGFMDTDIEEARQLRKEERQGQGIIPDIEFPKVKMSKAMKRFFGDNIGRLKVTGSQKITIGGSSTKTSEVENESSDTSLFPDLKMEQELNLGISGTIGKKIKVDVKQTSNESIFESNKISIKYEGDEDDPIKLIEVGDTQLSLSGSSRYLGYSASSGDLFGIKGQFEFGKLKLTTIVCQQEGEQASASATGSSVEQETDYLDKNFACNKYFLFDEPENLFVDSDESPANPVNPDTLPMSKWYYISNKMPKEGTVKVFVSDGTYDPAEGDVTGYDLDDNEYKFHELTDPINEYFIDYEDSPYMIQLGVTIGNSYAIGVIYEEESGTQWGSYNNGVPTVKMIKKDYIGSDLTEAKWDYQIKNIYSLGGTNIDSDGFDLKIFYKDPSNDGKETFGIVDTTDNVLNKFIDILDLDTNGDGVVNGSDGTVDLKAGTVQFDMWEPFQPYWFGEDSTEFGNPEVYNELNPDTDEYNPFYLHVTSNQVGNTINLGYINIIEGSEKVYVDGVLMKEGVDYTINYIQGTVRLQGDAASDPNADVKINFEYKPIFSVDQTSMFGVRADYEFNDNARLGATVMYEGGSTSEEHVKVGGEPTKIFAADIDGSVKTEVPFITDLVDMIPLVRTNETSTVELSGEVAMNIPDPNTTEKGEAYIDDMESINETYSIGISRTEYDFASYPVEIDSLMADTLETHITRGDFNWYNPHNVYQKKDIYADLPTDEGNDYVSVLECKLEPISLLPNWGGIMQSFGTSAEDFEDKKYLELTMKAEDAVQGDMLFINFGTMSEDYYPITHPNGDLNYEDTNQDGILDVGEDTGLDNVEGTDPVPPKSHESDGDEGIDDGNDDYNYSAGSSDYSGINGTESNGRLDTEDLNNNYILDTKNDYFQYAIDLTDVDPEILISEYNDWMFIRIPLQDSTYFRPRGDKGVSWNRIRNVRIWMKTETTDDLIIDIETFNLVGNKWIASSIMDTTLHTPSNLQPDEAFEVATENNENNPDYTPPPGSLTDDDDTEKEIEQSLVLEIQNLEPNRYIYAKEIFSDAFDLLNYNKVKLWVYAQYSTGPPPNASDTETIFFRLGSDTSNYYEYRQSVEVYDDIDSKMQESRWQGITVDFTEFTDLKKAEVSDTSAHLRIVGNPSLGYVKQIAVGLIRPDSMETTFSGRIFFDDIRVSDANGEIGLATRLSLDTKLADFANINIDFERKTPNFYSLNESGGSNKDSYSYSINNTLYLQKFFPDEWGISIPLRFDYSFEESKPRFLPSSDVRLTSAEEREKYKTLSEGKYASISFDKSKKSSNFFSRLLLDNTYIKATVQQSKTLSPTDRDTTLIYTGIFNYRLDIGNELLTLDVFDDFSIYFVPQEISLNTNYNYKRYNTWSKQVLDTLYIKDDTTPTHTFKPELAVDYELFTDFDADYNLNMTRNLVKVNKVSGVNIGVETSRDQDVTLKYTPGYLKSLNFNTKYETIYEQDRVEDDDDDTLIVQYEVANAKKTSADITLTFKKWGEKIMELIEVEEVIEKDDGEDELMIEKEMFEIDKKELEDMQIQEEAEIETENKEEISDSTKVEIENPPESEEEGASSQGLKKMLMYVTKAIGYSVKILGNADFRYENTYRTKYLVPMDSLPDIYYQLGLHDQAPGSIQSTGQSDAFTANTRTTFDISSFLSATVNAKYTIDLEKASGNKTKTESITLPGIEFGFSGIDDLLKLKFLKSSNLSSGFSRTISNSGSGFWKKPDLTTETYNFSPLLSFNTKLLNKVSTNLGINYSFSNQESFTDNKRKTRDDDIGVGLSFGYSFQAAKGIKIPLFGRLKMTNKTDMNLDLNYTSSRTKYINSSMEKWGSSSNTNTLTIKPRMTYNFSRDIDAGLTGSYILKKDVKGGTTTATTSLNIWVKFQF